MMTLLIVTLSLLAFVYYYSLGVYFALKKLGVKGPGRAFIPFYAFSLVNQEAGEFTIFTIPVKKYGTFTLSLFVAIILCVAYGVWGEANLPVASIGPLWDIMNVVIILCVICLYASFINSYHKFALRFELTHPTFLAFLIALVLPIPFVYYFLSKQALRIL